MSFSVGDGSGRATCQICEKIIEKGKMNQVRFHGGYGTHLINHSCHLDCLINYEKVMALMKLQKENEGDANDE